MTIVGVTCQTVLNRLMLQSCQLCDVAHDFRYDPSIYVTENGKHINVTEKLYAKSQ